MKLNIGDRVYKFYNGHYHGGVCVVVEADDEGYGIIHTDCLVNGVKPTIENTKPERYGKDGVAIIKGLCIFTIHKATEELMEKIEKYNTRMTIINNICELLDIGERNKRAATEKLLTRSTKQLFAILLILITKADGKRGICSISDSGKLENDFFIEEELINYIEEPKED